MDMEPPNFGRLFGACSLEIFMRWWLKVIVVALMQPAWHMSSNSTNRMPDPANMSETAHEPTRRRRSAERASRALSCHSRHWGACMCRRRSASRTAGAAPGRGRRRELGGRRAAAAADSSAPAGLRPPLARSPLAEYLL